MARWNDRPLQAKLDSNTLLSDVLDLPKPFGPYSLLRRLAVGGMAEVYVAKTKGIGGFEKLVAIKVIHPRFSQDQHFVQMLVEEAKISVQLNHVNIAQTFDLGCIDGTYYIAMEFVEGADVFRIQKRVKEQRVALPIDICCYIAAEVCKGLGYAHRKRDPDGNPLGIVHRDISPQNVLVSHAGEVKIVDFGIAKAALRSGQTEVGVIKGKYYYMSPEQAWGDSVDPRTDVFATGLVLHELLTGEMVYREENNVLALLDKVRKAEIPTPRARRRGLSSEVEAVLMKALAKEAGDRFQSAHAFGEELTRCLYRINPTFTASRAGQIMATLFPEEVRRHSQVLELPAELSAHFDLAPLSRDEFTPSVEASVIFDLSDVGDESTRNDILPFRRGRAEPAVPPASHRGDRSTMQLERSRARREEEITAQLEASKDEWDEATLLKSEEWEGESTLVEREGRSMQAVIRLLGERATSADGDGSELAGEKTVATSGFPSPPGPARASLGELLPSAPVRSPAPPRREVPLRPVAVFGRPPPAEALENEETSAYAPAPRPDGTSRGPDPRVEDWGALDVSELPAERSGAWDETTGLLAGARREPLSAVQPSRGGPRYGPESDRSFATPAAPASLRPGPFDPLDGGAQPVRWDPSTWGPAPGADPFEAQPALALGDGLGKPEPRRWLSVIAIALVAALLVVGVVGALVALRNEPTTLEIISVPEGARVEVEGYPVAETPANIPNVESGRTYRVSIRRAGYEPREADLRVVEGANRSVFLLNQIRVTLRVETQPPNAQVWIDNLLRGSAPLDIPGLAAGQRVLLRSSAPGHEVVTREVTLADDERAPRIILELPPSAR